MVVPEDDDGESILVVPEQGAEDETIVVPEQGADDKTIAVLKGTENEPIVVVPELLKVKQLSCKKALKMNQLWS